MGFLALQGFTQGDVKSTIGWVATFDILLTAFRQMTEMGELLPVYQRKTGSQLHPFLAWAYADDLVTVSTSSENGLSAQL